MSVFESENILFQSFSSYALNNNWSTNANFNIEKLIVIITYFNC